MARARSGLPERVGLRLRALRTERNLTQEQVAERAGFTGKYVSEIERGLRDPSLTTLERIVERGIGCSLDQALGGLGTRRLSTDASSTTPHVPLPAPVLALAIAIAEIPTRPVRQRFVRLVSEMLRLMKDSS